jgi:hypothetical protein
LEGVADGLVELSAAAATDDPEVWWPPSPRGSVGEPVASATRLLVWEGAEDPVGLALDDAKVPEDPVRGAPSELGIEDGEFDREFGPPVGDVVVDDDVARTAAFGANPLVMSAKVPPPSRGMLITNSVLVDVKHSVDILQESVS